MLCKLFLIYLNADTWRTVDDEGARATAFAEEVRVAMEAGCNLVLVHEMPGLGQEEHRGIEFGTFFSSPEGATPGTSSQSDHVSEACGVCSK